ncbi:uncharacterized protein TM35_000113080 [Trypanosoma theileri]|uniref:Uncharacterized protein n=1 Tax=Trypanosoma theileri TaxID=67003 RepID=A0A1X0NYL0_9TRYP|nr:uncharacterized protein TM35_000113080 [Trypanosoma theileri]ORC89774.1 hypothetical protein TM35_000113080 [Trypanosoma theileri]
MNEGDVNEMLLATTTASAAGVEASERWLTRAKKRGNASTASSALDNTTEENVLFSDTRTRKKLRSERNNTHNITGRDHITTSDTLVKNDVRRPLTSSLLDSEPETHVRQLMAYVMNTLLGGRHNATRGDGKEITTTPPSRAVLLSETSTMRPVALYQIHHSVCGKNSITQSEKTADAIVRHRRKLHVCSHERDLVGGLVDGKPQHTRRHLLTLVTAALKGERMDIHQPIQTNVNAVEENTKKTEVVLFESAKGKTLSSFLQSSSSSSCSSSSSDDGDGDD